MFSGIVDHCGEVLRIEFCKNISPLWINSHFNDLSLWMVCVLELVAKLIAKQVKYYLQNEVQHA